MKEKLKGFLKRVGKDLTNKGKEWLDDQKELADIKKGAFMEEKRKQALEEGKRKATRFGRSFEEKEELARQEGERKARKFGPYN